MPKKQYIADNAQLIAEWDIDENTRLGLDPAKLLCGSNKKAWWRCTKGHKWMAVISSRAIQGTGCPYCSGRKTLSGYNDLITLNPFLAKEWDYLSNNTTPQQYTHGSKHEPTWICHQCGHRWSAAIYSRVAGKGCPQCAKVRRVLTRKGKR